MTKKEPPQAPSFINKDNLIECVKNELLYFSLVFPNWDKQQVKDLIKDLESLEDYLAKQYKWDKTHIQFDLAKSAKQQIKKIEDDYKSLANIGVPVWSAIFKHHPDKLPARIRKEIEQFEK